MSQQPFSSDNGFSTTGNITASYLVGNGVSITGVTATANTGNVTFDNNAVIGTGDEYGYSGLYLAPGANSVGNVQYLRVRGGDYPTHIHLDTGDNGYFDQYFGDDGKYVKLESGGNISIGTNTHNWTFGLDGTLTLPEGGTIDNTPEIVTVTLDQFTDAGYPGTQVFTKVSDTLYEVSPGGPYMTLVSGIWRLKLSTATYYDSTDLITWETVAGGLPTPVGTLGTVASMNLGVGGNTWAFGGDGSLTFPIGISIDNSVDPQFPKIIADPDKAFSIQGQGANGSAALGWTVDPNTASQYATVGVTKNGGDNLAKVVLQAQSDSGNVATVKLWKFDETGNLTLPNGAVIKDTAGNSVAFGLNAGQSGQGVGAVAIGGSAGNVSQGQYAVAVGTDTGNSSQGAFAVAIGYLTGTISQGNSAVAIGGGTGTTSQGLSAVAIGVNAGYVSQGGQAVAVGALAGSNVQGMNSVAIGTQAGYETQGGQSVAIGIEAGKTQQGNNSVAIGTQAGNSSQGTDSVAIGTNAGETTQGLDSVAIGYQAGSTTQGNLAVAIGYLAGNTSQGAQSVAIGDSAGATTQGASSVAVGQGAGQTTQGTSAVAVGFGAGATTQGVHAIAIGRLAGQTNQGNNSIILNATGDAVNQTTANTFTVKPVRQANTANAMYYDSSTGEITYDTAGGGLQSSIANGTSNVNIATANNDVVITSNGTNEWTFGSTGDLTFPTGNLVIFPKVEQFGNSAVIASALNNLITLSTGANGGLSSLWVEDYENIGTSNIAAVYANPTPGSKIVRIAVGQNGSPGPYLWDFDGTGNATFPSGGTTNLHDVVSVGLATFSNVQIGGNLNYAESANLIVVEDKDGFADIIAQNKNSGGNASMNIVLVNDDPGNVYMAVGVNSSTFTPLYNTLFEIPDAGYVSHSTTQVMGPQSAESGQSRMFFTYSSGSYALELNDHGAIGWGATYDGNLTQGNFGNAGQVLTSAGENSAPTWTNFSTIANGTSNVNIATANGNVTITSNGGNTWTFDNDGNLTLPSDGYLRVAKGIISTGASPAPSLSGFSSVSAINISASGNITGNKFIGNGALLTNVVQALIKPNNLLYVAKNGSDITGTGSINAPYQTVQAAIDAAAGDTATTIILAPGSYVENLTIANVANSLNITGSGMAESAINGNIVISGTSDNIEFDNFRVSTGRITHSATGYWSVLNMRFSANTGITKTSTSTIKIFNTDLGASGTGNILLQGGKTNIYSSQIFNVQISGANTEVNFLQCDTVILPTVISGNVNFFDTNLVSSGSGNSLNAIGGYVTLKNCLSITPSRTLAPIGFGAGASYSYGDSAFDVGNSTFAGTAIVQQSQFQAINVRGGNITSNGLISVTGNVTAGNISTGIITLTNGAVIKDTAGDAVAFGQGAGNTTQGTYSVAVGTNAGQSSQGNISVAVGWQAANTSQGSSAVAIGRYAGSLNQGNFAVAVGASAAQTSQGEGAVAIGWIAGTAGQGQRSIAIGWGAGTDATTTVPQGNNAIVLNATGSALNSPSDNTFTVSPIRNDVANTAQVMFYNTTSKEITYGNTISVAGNIQGNYILGNGSQLTNVAQQTTGSWTVTAGTNNYSFTVSSGTYNMWVTGNIPNGIIAWNALATITNTNVPVVGTQYAWVYDGGGTPLDFVSIPNQFTGTANAIVRSNVAPSSNTNTFTFSINNTSGNSAVVNWGYTKL